MSGPLAEQIWPLTSFDAVGSALRKKDQTYASLAAIVVNSNAQSLKSRFGAIKGQKLVDALMIDPFPLPQGYKYAHDRPWTYIEVATRVRFLYSVLINFAADPNGPKSKRKEELVNKIKNARSSINFIERREKAGQAGNPVQVGKHEEEIEQAKTELKSLTYLHRFFDYITTQTDTRTKSLFPEDHRTKLLANQSLIDLAIVDKRLKITEEKLKEKRPTPFKAADVPFKIDLLDKNPPFKVSEITVPKDTPITEFTESSVPIGPVSLEVAFILALQFAGLDLAALVASRVQAARDRAFVGGQPFPAPRMYTCASFQEGPGLGFGANSNVRWFKEDLTDPRDPRLVHTTVRTRDVQTANTTGAGVTVGIDLEDGLNYTALEQNRRFFSFSFHAVDSATAGQSNTPNEKKVWPHCHQGWWETDWAFQMMFLSAGKSSKPFDPKGNQLLYRQVQGNHMYLMWDTTFLKSFKGGDPPTKSKL